MIFIACVYFAQAISSDQLPKLHRTFRKNQVDSYSVKLDSQGDAGSGQYEYQIRFKAGSAIQDTDNTKVVATFNNLSGKVEDLDLPRRKLFGSAGYSFPATGFPSDFSFGGQDGRYLVPVLAWYLPLKEVELGAEFEIPEMRFDSTFGVRGKGKLLKFSKSMATLEYHFQITARKNPVSNSNISGETGVEIQSSLDVTSTFNVSNGSVSNATGTMKGFGGTLSFHVTKI